MERLNDNEVKEVARMQQKIDSYEGFIRAAFIMAKSGHRVNYPIFSHTDLYDEMNFILENHKRKVCKQ